MELSLHGLRFRPPSSLSMDEVTFSLRAETTMPSAPLALQKKTSVCDNLIVSRRIIEKGARPPTPAETLADLITSLGPVESLGQEPITFDDDTMGHLVAYDVSVEGV